MLASGALRRLGGSGMVSDSYFRKTYFWVVLESFARSRRIQTTPFTGMRRRNLANIFRASWIVSPALPPWEPPH